MYINKKKEAQIREAATEIKKLAKLETCSLPDKTKEEIRLWVKWFDSQAERILQAMGGKENS